MSDPLLEDTPCPCCGMKTQFAASFCTFCGSRIAAESVDERFLFRLGLIERLTQLGVEKRIDADAYIVRQMDDIRALIREDAAVRERCQSALDQHEQFLIAQASRGDVRIWLEVIREAIETFPEGTAVDVRKLQAELKTTVDRIADIEKSLADGKKINQEKLATWVAQRAAALGWTPQQFRNVILFEPMHWRLLAAELDPQSIDRIRVRMPISKGREAQKQKNYDAAKRHFEAALLIDRTNAEALEGLGFVHLQKGDPAAAIECYKRGLLSGDGNPDALNNLAWQLCPEGLPEAERGLALWAVHRALELIPLAPYWDTLAEVLDRMGNVDGAVAAAREALREQPRRPQRQERLLNLMMKALPPVDDDAAASVDIGNMPLDISMNASKSGAQPQPPRANFEMDDMPMPSLDGGPSSEPTPTEPSLPTLPLPNFEPSLPPPSFESTPPTSPDTPPLMPSFPPPSFEMDNAPPSHPKPEKSEIDWSIPDISASEEEIDDSSTDGSEFELTLDDDMPLASGRTNDDAKFELTLDDDGGVMPVDAEAEPKRDIFDTEFEIPALDEEGAVHDEEARHDDLEATESDFELAINDSVDSEDSASAPVTLDDDDGALHDMDMEELPSKSPTTSKRTGRGDYRETPQVQRDPVDCSIYAPATATPGTSVMLQIFAHIPNDAAKARAMAQEFDPDATQRGQVTLATEIARGSKLTFELKMPSKVHLDRTKADLVWRGTPDSVQFEIEVPDDLKPQNIIGTLYVSQDGAPIGDVKFKLSIVKEPVATPPEPAVVRRYQTAFASYASPDRDEVIKRVQVLRAAGIRCFQDVLDLEPGDRWERELYHHIDNADVLFLFWSENAKQSEWVEKEWRYAMDTKGDEIIRPVILKAKPFVPPPPELAHIHFNDGLLHLTK